MAVGSTRKSVKYVSSRCDPALIRRLQALDSCAVSDAVDAVELHSASVTSNIADVLYARSMARVALGLQPLKQGWRIAGTAATVALRPVKGRLARLIGPSRSAPQQTGHLGTATIAAALPGQVVVVANGGRLDMGAWGGLLSLAAQVKGLTGVVVDGACRDIDEIRQLGFPVFARSGTPTTARGRVEIASIDAAIFVDGVRVRPLDFVIADGSGVVFIPREIAAEVIERAELLVAREDELATALRAGRPATAALDRQYEEMLHG